VFESGEAEKIYMSVLPELNDAFSDRSLVGLSLEDGDRLVLTVRAEDAVSMRSALNTWFRLIHIAQEVSDLTAAAQ